MTTRTKTPARAGRELLDYYSRPGVMTSAGRHAAAFSGLPHAIGDLAGVVQGLAIHEYAAADLYGFEIPEGRKAESHIRSVELMLERILELDDRPLTAPRPPEKRLVGVCHHFMMLLLAMLRAQGVPVRGRRGFGAYFNRGYFEDHVVCEYWNTSDARWVLVDPQFDEVWRARLKIEHDVLDVPRDRFLIAWDAWMRCRSGVADPSKFGIFKGNLRGLWFVADNLVHDLATLNKMEMLQWDTWGAMPRPEQPLDEQRIAYFDRLATLTREPDASYAELRRRFDEDDGVSVPGTVYNAVLNRVEEI